MAATVCKVIGYILLVPALILHFKVIVGLMEDYGTFISHFPGFAELCIILAMLLYYLPGLAFLAIGQRLVKPIITPPRSSNNKNEEQKKKSKFSGILLRIVKTALILVALFFSLYFLLGLFISL